MAKGKLVQRSWAELPREAVLLVAEQLEMLDVPRIPPAWATESRHVQHRLVWNAIIQAQMYEGLQNVCRNWEQYLNDAPFWRKAAHLLDPRKEHEIHNRNTAHDKLTAAEIYRHIYNSSCIPCRVNSWYTSAGIGTSTHMEQTTLLNVIGCCEKHSSMGFCFVCLQDWMPRELNHRAVAQNELDRHGCWAGTCLQPNDDWNTFPHARTLCRPCRSQQLEKSVIETVQARDPFRRAQSIPPSFHAIRDYIIGGVDDVETVVTTVAETLWLDDLRCGYTEMLVQRFQLERARRTTRHGHISPDDDLDAHRLVAHPKSLIQPRREALSHWAHVRIMGGTWVAPSDTLHESFPALEYAFNEAHRQGELVLHPFTPLLPDYGVDQHTMPAAIDACQSKMLWDDMNLCFEQQFRTLVTDAVRNCVHRVLAIAHVRGMDIVPLITSVHVEDLLTPEFLYAPENWCGRYDWRARYGAIDQTDSDTDSLQHKPPTRGSDATSSSSDERPSPPTTLRTSPSSSPGLDPKSLDSISGTPSPTSPISHGHESLPSSSSEYVRRTKSARQWIIDLAPSDHAEGAADLPMQPFRNVPKLPASPAVVGPRVWNILTSIWREMTSTLLYCECTVCVRTKLAAEEHAKVAQTENELINQLIDAGEWDGYVRDNGNRERERSIPVFSEDEEGYFDDEDEEEEEEEDYEYEYDSDVLDSGPEEPRNNGAFVQQQARTIVAPQQQQVMVSSNVPLRPVAPPPIPATYMPVAHSHPNPMAQGLLQQRLGPAPILPLQGLVDPRLARRGEVGSVALKPVLAPATVPGNTMNQLAHSVLAPPAAAAQLVSAAASVLSNTLSSSPVRSTPPPSVPISNRPPPRPSKSKRRSRSRSPSPTPSPTLSSSDDRRANKRVRSTSPIPVPDLQVGMEGEVEKESARVRTRAREDEDVGGPDGEIVLLETERGHGRKRVRSFDAGARSVVDGGGEATANMKTNARDA